jgi:hypothetical protein
MVGFFVGSGVVGDEVMVGDIDGVELGPEVGELLGFEDGVVDGADEGALVILYGSVSSNSVVG